MTSFFTNVCQISRTFPNPPKVDHWGGVGYHSFTNSNTKKLKLLYSKIKPAVDERTYAGHVRHVCNLGCRIAGIGPAYVAVGETIGAAVAAEAQLLDIFEDERLQTSVHRGVHIDNVKAMARQVAQVGMFAANLGLIPCGNVPL